MPGAIDHVFLDIGGVLYDDRVYAEAWRRALREAGGDFTDAAFDEEYAACRAGQDRSFRVRLSTAFLGPDPDLAALEARASRYWHYPPSALHADALPTLEALRTAGYRLGVIANQPSQVRAALERDGLVAVLRDVGRLRRSGAAQARPGAVRPNPRAGRGARRAHRDGGGSARLRHGAGEGGGHAHDLGAARRGAR